MAFKLPELGYAYDALEPNIDARTMEIHHSKHHNGYTTKLNGAIAGTDLEESSIENILGNLDMNNGAVRNNGGGFYNHSLFWETIGPNSGDEPKGKILELINGSFGDFESFKSEFSEKAMKQFGSGWGWLCQDSSGKLVTLSTPNQDSPISSGLNPILGLDVWEHAYYLNYQNRRPDYIKAFWEIIDWASVEGKLK